MPITTGHCTLPDGRMMGYALHGDPAAAPVLYCHGWPGSRLDIGLLADPPVRLIAPDRPGYGLSSPHSGHGLLGWAQDVAVLADQLGVARFRVVGVSAGAAYALALASTLASRVRAVALVNAVPPPDTAHAQAGAVRHLFRLGRHPRAARVVLAAARTLLQSPLSRHAHLLARFLPEADRAALTRETTAALLDAWREGVRPGVAGLLADAALLAHPWGLALPRIDVPVLIWHGAQDSLVPAGCTQAFRALPQARITIVPDAGHYAVPLRNGSAILAALASAG